MGVDMRILFVVVGYRNSINSVQQTQKEYPPKGWVFFFLKLGIRKSNPSCRWQLGRYRLDGIETIIFCEEENANESLLLRAAHRAAIFVIKPSISVRISQRY
jgi:hypothetical protein